MNDQKEAKKVLIIEDDREIANVVVVNLESNRIKIEQVHDGQLGLEKSNLGSLILLFSTLCFLDLISAPCCS